MRLHFVTGVVLLAACSSGGGSDSGDAGTTAGDGGTDVAPSTPDGSADAPATQDGKGAPDTTTAAVAVGPAGGACPDGAQYGSPLPANPTATLISDQNFVFLEGPVWVASQSALYFSDISGTTTGRIHKHTPADGKIVVFADKIGTNGLALDTGDQIVAASHDMQRLTRLDPQTGQRSQIPGSDLYNGKPFNSTNDVVVQADGNIYFTDPNYQQDGRAGQDATAFYRLSPAGAVTRIGMEAGPNGIAISPDGEWLYVASTGGAPLRKFALAKDGTASAMGQTVSASSSDGMAVDCAGNLYLTTSDGGKSVVRVISPSGQMIGLIGGFADGTSNAAFGGADRKTLFVTAGGGLYQIKLNVPGFPN